MARQLVLRCGRDARLSKASSAAAASTATTKAMTNTAVSSVSAASTAATSTPRWCAPATPGPSSNIRPATRPRKPRRAKPKLGIWQGEAEPAWVYREKKWTDRRGRRAFGLRHQGQRHGQRPHLPHAVEPLVRQGQGRALEGRAVVLLGGRRGEGGFPSRAVALGPSPFFERAQAKFFAKTVRGSHIPALASALPIRKAGRGSYRVHLRRRGVDFVRHRNESSVRWREAKHMNAHVASSSQRLPSRSDVASVRVPRARGRADRRACGGGKPELARYSGRGLRRQDAA